MIQIGEPFRIPRTPRRPRGTGRIWVCHLTGCFVSDITADLVLVEMLNVHCENCLNRVEAYNTFKTLKRIRHLETGLKMMAVGVAIQGEIQRFSSEYHVRFPLVADPQFTLHAAVGKPVTPFSIRPVAEETGCSGGGTYRAWG
ncbi:MAG: hypothetical protein R2875_04575 [Desulfobacterales bacterium]